MLVQTQEWLDSNKLSGWNFKFESFFVVVIFSLKSSCSLCNIMLLFGFFYLQKQIPRIFFQMYKFTYGCFLFLNFFFFVFFANLKNIIPFKASTSLIKLNCVSKNYKNKELGLIYF